MAELNKRLEGIKSPDAKALLASSDYLIRKSIWSFGGDGWAYDIGFGGMDHVFASGRDVNLLVLDTEVYSNTGGQASKSTFRGAVAKFAAGGKPGCKKDLGMIAMPYGNVFVGSISLGAHPMHAIRTIRAAESYRGTSLLIAFSHCINWCINMVQGMEIQKQAVACGYWPLYSFDPRNESHPFQLASKRPEGALQGLRPEGGPVPHPGALEARRIGSAVGPRPAATSTSGITSTSNWPAWNAPLRPRLPRTSNGGNGDRKAERAEVEAAQGSDTAASCVGPHALSPAKGMAVGWHALSPSEGRGPALLSWHAPRFGGRMN